MKTRYLSSFAVAARGASARKIGLLPFTRAWWQRRQPGATPAARAGHPSARQTLATARALIEADLACHLTRMSARDLRLYLCLTSASCISTLIRLRFDLFDLWCRWLGETVALTRLRDFDRCLASGQR